MSPLPPPHPHPQPTPTPPPAKFPLAFFAPQLPPLVEPEPGATDEFVYVPPVNIPSWLLPKKPAKPRKEPLLVKPRSPSAGGSPALPASPHSKSAGASPRGPGTPTRGGHNHGHGHGRPPQVKLGLLQSLPESPMPHLFTMVGGLVLC